MRDKPKIIVLNDFAHVSGGASQVALSSAITLAQQGYDVTVFAAVGPVMPELTSQPNLQVVCTDQHDILKDPKRSRAFRQGIWNSKAAKTFSEVLDLADPRDTVVHVHGWTKALSSSPVCETVKRGFRTVLSLHDYFIGCPNGGFFIYPTSQICHLRGMSLECLLTNSDARSYAHKLWRVGRQAVQNRFGQIPKGIEHFIAISDLSYEVLKPYLPANASVYFVRNPIEVSKQDPAKIQENSAFVTVGRLTKEKGPHLLAETSHRLGTETVFVGDGECRDLVLETDSDATVTGWVSRQEVLGHLTRARALVIPSLWYEVQPLVFSEAAALGVPAIVSSSCAARYMVEDGVTGLVFKSGDVDDLAEKIAVLQDAKTASEMGLAAYERYWADPATLDSHTKRLEEVYTRILQP